jgi:hypothetical protein
MPRIVLKRAFCELYLCHLECAALPTPKSSSAWSRALRQWLKSGKYRTGCSGISSKEGAARNDVLDADEYL